MSNSPDTTPLSAMATFFAILSFFSFLFGIWTNGSVRVKFGLTGLFCLVIAMFFGTVFILAKKKI